MVADSRATLFFTLIVSALAQNSTTVAPAISLPVPPLVLYIVCGVCSFGAIVSCVFFVLACTGVLFSPKDKTEPQNLDPQML
ncbi:hypothetical protein M3Y96_00017200 [Aphelenchoides besseyi]|nr:hypothetical protein M3Y96_00017200 [Aphelenchoides besseyi]